MNIHYRWIAVSFALASIALPAIAGSCEDLAKISLPATTISAAQNIPAGSYTPTGGFNLSDLPAFCRVAGVLKPSSDSNILFEVWMPASGWTGKFQGVGNGGFAGSINYSGLADSIRHGYAAASTDTGHEAGVTDASWALNHPEKLADFGYRAIHEMTDKAKSVVRAFYGDAPHHAYFSSCSNGGRQALMEAQRFPADYDGIVAGAPANYWSHLLASAVYISQSMLGDAYIPAAKIPAIDAAVIEACDALDGVKDGVIDNPSKCKFDPGKLLCAGAESNACLTAPQVAGLRKIYDGMHDSKGQSLFPGLSHGGEAGSGGWPLWVSGPAPNKSLLYAFGTQFFKNAVFADPSWDLKALNPEHDVKLADDKISLVMNSNNPDLSGFKKRGGKLIIYHGWSDAAIAPQNAINYYQSVVAKMGARDTKSFVRLFMVPGMQHCGGGPGPNSFGQFGAASGDPRHDVAAALELWVDKGQAPEEIVATKYKGQSPASGVARTRPLCAYPAFAKWNGKGSSDDAANFTCEKPAGAH